MNKQWEFKQMHKINGLVQCDRSNQYFNQFQNHLSKFLVHLFMYDFQFTQLKSIIILWEQIGILGYGVNDLKWDLLSIPFYVIY